MEIHDLIQHARRLARRKAKASIAIVHLAASPYIMASTARYHYFRNSIGELATRRGAELVELEGHRICLAATDVACGAALHQLLTMEAEAWRDGTPLGSILEIYELPDQYAALRERLEVLQTFGAEPLGAAAAVEHEALAGPLTPDRLARIEAALDGIDLEPFVRRQSVHRLASHWPAIYTEHFTSLDDLRTKLFPLVEIESDTPLFFELCRHLDRLMLVALLLNRPWRRQRIGLNLGHAAWTTDEYRRLMKCLDDEERSRLTIELHWLDAVQDSARGGQALAEMREAGFKIAIDRIGIEALPLLALDRLNADWYKIGFDISRLPHLLSADHLGPLRRLEPERLILTQTDDKLAIELGQKLQIRHYQGWLIDRLAKASRPGAGTAAAA